MPNPEYKQILVAKLREHKRTDSIIPPYNNVVLQKKMEAKEGREVGVVEGGVSNGMEESRKDGNGRKNGNKR
jgi:hypothetical protein